MADLAATVLFPRLRRRLNRARVRQLARRLAREVAPGRTFTCVLTGDAELRHLNRQFLGRDYATDVLSFPAPRGTGLQPVHYLGDTPRGTGLQPVHYLGDPPRGTGLQPVHYPGDTPRGTGLQPVHYLGDIAISVSRAAAQARRWGHSLEEEIGLLMLHGVLHLKGYDHEGDRGRMARVEARWRKALGLPAGLTERGRR